MSEPLIVIRRLTLYILRSKFEFSFAAPIYFLQKKWGEVDKISSKFILCDHVLNSQTTLFYKSLILQGEI